MLEMTKMVGQLVAVAAAPPSTTPSSVLAIDTSPIRRNRAFRCIADTEALSPRSLANARVIFRGRVELADEYNSFGTSGTEVSAASDWLNYELQEVARTRQRD
jgi:hypothetical protein